MRLHHARAQPQPAAARRRDRARATRAATRRRPRRSAGEFGGAASFGDYRAAIDDPRIDAVVVAVPPALPPGSDAPGARRGQARARREAGVSADGGLSGGRRRPRPGRPRGDRRRERSLQAARRDAAQAAGAQRDRRDGVRAHHDHRPAPEDRRRLAQRRGHGRRRRVLRRRDPLAAPRRQPRSADRAGLDSWIPPGRGARRRRRRSPRTRACWWRSATTTARSGSVSYSREIPSLFQGPAALEDIGARRRDHVRIERPARRGPRQGLSASLSTPASATSAATRRCIATSPAPSGSAARPR